MNALIVIPARMESERFPGKPMASLNDQPLIRMVYEATMSATNLNNVVVSSSDDIILEYCDRHGMEHYESSQGCFTGTHRCAQTAFEMGLIQRFWPSGYDVIVNWQVDEPLVKPEWVRRLIKVCAARREIATLTAPRDTDERLTDRNIVKVHVNQGHCWNFSRGLTCNARLHCGVYAFPRAVLEYLGDLPPTERSQGQSLEQLAWLEDGWPIRSVEIPYLPQSVNVPGDIPKLEAAIRAEKQ